MKKSIIKKIVSFATCVTMIIPTFTYSLSANAAEIDTPDNEQIMQEYDAYIVQTSQIGTYATNNDQYASIIITQNYVTLSNVYIDGKYVYAQIPTSNTGSSFYLTNGYSACTLKSGTFYSRSSYNSSWQLDIGWDINFTTYGSFNYIFPNYYDPVWTISIGNVDYVEIQT